MVEGRGAGGARKLIEVVLDELPALLASRAVPILGVLLIGWNARLVLFIISWEAISASVVLGWIFNYPERSTARGVLMVLLLLPTSLLLWLVLAQNDPTMRASELVVESLRATWVAVLLIVWHAITGALGNMKKVRRQGATIRRNNRILVAWLFHVYVPFLLFVLIMLAFRNVDAWALAAILGAKTLVDLLHLWIDRRMERAA